jgi:methylenetetrahydrofolate reductase (NADPH)
VLVERGTVGEQFFDGRLRNGREAGDDSWRRGGWYRLLSLSNLYRKAALDCVMCGDCVADRLAYATCPMSHCYKELRNGPCGGSRLDGSCEADPQQPCVWNLAYESTPSNGTGPSTFATTVVPSRDWSLDRTDALANRMAGLDNYTRRETLGAGGDGE